MKRFCVCKEPAKSEDLEGPMSGLEIQPYMVRSEKKYETFWFFLNPSNAVHAATVFSQEQKKHLFFFNISFLPPPKTLTFVRADFREGDEDSNFSVFRVRQFTESPEPLH